MLFIQCSKLAMFLQYYWMVLCFLFMILVVITFVLLWTVFANTILTLWLSFILSLPFMLRILYLVLIIFVILIVSCIFRAVLQPLNTVRRTPLTQWERRTKSVSRNRVNIPAPLSISFYSCGILSLHYVNHGPRRQRSWPVNIHYVMFSQIVKPTLLPEWESGFSIPWFNLLILNMQKWHWKNCEEKYEKILMFRKNFWIFAYHNFKTNRYVIQST